jgi:hypothetical protein
MKEVVGMIQRRMEYTQSEAGEILLDTPTIPQDDDEARDEFTGDVIHYQTINPEVTQAIRMAKEYCAIGRGAKKAEDGRQALEHTRTVRMTAYNSGERGIKKCSESMVCK